MFDCAMKNIMNKINEYSSKMFPTKLQNVLNYDIIHYSQIIKIHSWMDTIHIKTKHIKRQLKHNNAHQYTTKDQNICVARVFM